MASHLVSSMIDTMCGIFMEKYKLVEYWKQIINDCTFGGVSTRKCCAETSAIVTTNKKLMKALSYVTIKGGLFELQIKLYIKL